MNSREFRRDESELPSNWSQTTLGEALEVLDTYRAPINNSERVARLSASEARFPYYGATGLVGEIDDFLLEGEAILLGEDGAPFLEPHKSKAYMVQGQYWVNNHAHILRGRAGVNNRFACYQLNSIDYSGYVSGTTRLKLTQADMRKMKLRLPPANEQLRIADKIDELFSRIEAGAKALQRAKVLVERYRKSVLKAAVTGELTKEWRENNKDKIEPANKLLERILKSRREAWEKSELAKMKAKGKAPENDNWKTKYPEPIAAETTNLPDLPEGWVWASVDQLTTHITSGSRDWKPFYNRGNGVFIMAQNVRPLKLDLSERQLVDPPKNNRDAIRSLVKIDDLLVTIVGANTGDVCRVPIELEKHYVCQSVALVRPTEKRHSPFLEMYLGSDGPGKDQLFKYIYGAGRPHLGFEELKSIAVPVMASDERELIADSVLRYLSNTQSVIDQISENERSSVKLRQSILMFAFEGKLVPQDPSDEPASALLGRIRSATAAHKLSKPNKSK